MPLRVFDALVLMREAEMTEEERASAIDFAKGDGKTTGFGNFGAMALEEKLGWAPSARHKKHPRGQKRHLNRAKMRRAAKDS